MWIEVTSNGKYKYFERYTDPYTLKVKKVTVTLAKNTAQAKKQAQRLLNEKIEERLNEKEIVNLTIENLLDEWWNQHKRSIRNNSIKAYGTVIKYIQKNFNMNVLISKADTKLFQRFFNSLDHSYEYRKKFRTVFKMMFDYAVNMEYISSNPVDKTKILKPASTIENYRLIEQKYLTREEVEKLLSVYYSTFQSARLGYLAEFMYLTGVRIGEAISLTTEDFIPETKQVNIHGTLDYSEGYKNAKKELTKTAASYREIALSDRAAEILKTLIFENQIKFNNKDNDYIFVGKTGKPIRITSFNASLKRMNEKLGENKIQKNLTSHIFRHSHISLLAELNIPIKTIMQRVGHTDEKITLQIYTHVTKKQKVVVAEELSKLGL